MRRARFLLPGAGFVMLFACATLIASAQASGPGSTADAADLRRWAEQGFSAEDAKSWIEVGIDPIEARQWQTAGIPFAGWANQWKEQGFTPVEAGRWASENINVYTAGDFRNAGFGVTESRAWIDRGVRSALRAKEFRDLRFTPEDAAEWWRQHFFPDDAAAWRDEGLTPQEALAWRYGEQESSYTYAGSKVTSRPTYTVEWARTWKALGVTPAEARLAIAYGITADEAAEWRQAGFSFEEGVEWKDAGFSPGDAASSRAAGMTPVEAEEKSREPGDIDEIVRLHSDITLRRDATIDVTETIVLTNGSTGVVEHCFERRFHGRIPLRRSRAFADEGWPSYWNLSVRENDAPAPYRVERTGGRTTLCIGAGVDEDDNVVPLTPGEHTFIIQYTTDDRVLDLHDQDRLFFDITGSDLKVPVRRATATVRLPQGADTVLADGFAGPPNRRYFTATLKETPGGDEIHYSVTRPLGVGMGFEVAVHLTRGFARAGLFRSLRRLDRQSGRILSSLAVFGAALLAALIYFAIAWRRVGRDPGRGVIVPLYEPPGDVSPAMARYLAKRRVDDRSVAATLVRLAQNGTLVIREREGFYRIEQMAGRTARLAPHETAFLHALFAVAPRIGLQGAGARRHLRAARHALRRALRTETTDYVMRNRRYLVPLLVVSVAGVLGAAAVVDPEVRNDVPAVVLACMTVTMIVLNLVFWSLIKAPTLATRKLLDDIEGFRRFLDASYRTPAPDSGHLTADLPPAVAVHLPYAIALGLETERASILDRRLQWYEGRSGGFSVGDFTRSLRRANSAVVSA